MVKTILRIVKIILLIVGLETGYAERSRKCQEIELAHIAERSRKSQSNFRASERRAELVRAMPSVAENVKKRCIYMNVKI